MSDMLFTYVRVNSPLHSLDPRTKLLFVMCVSILIFRLSTLVHLLGLLVFFLVLMLISQVPAVVFLRSLRTIAIFVFAIFMTHLIFTPGVPLMHSGPAALIPASFEGLVKGLVFALRFSLLILFATLLTATTRSGQITCGIERLLRPLKLPGVSSFDIATMMGLAIYFIPNLLSSATEIRDAQRARGLHSGHGPVKVLVSLSYPVLAASLRMVDDVSMAMESRCYQGEYRTSLYQLQMTFTDRFLCVMIPLILIYLLFFTSLATG